MRQILKHHCHGDIKIFSLDDGCSCDGEMPNLASLQRRVSGPLLIVEFRKNDTSRSRCTNALIILMCHFYCRGETSFVQIENSIETPKKAL